MKQLRARARVLLLNMLSTSCMMMAVFFVGYLSAHAAIVDGGEYYLRNNYYGMVLGQSSDGTTPRLSVCGSEYEAQSYVFVAERSGTDGWWLLRHKQTGRYLTASTTNTWSVVWSNTRGTGNEFLWQLDTRLNGSIVSRRATDKRLGCDWSEDETVPVYYDKAASSRARWSVFPALEGGYESSLSQAETDVYTNAQGHTEKDFWQITTDMTLDGQGTDIHIMSDQPFTEGGVLRLSDESSWVVFEHVSPSVVISKYLTQLRFDGRRAINGSNVRVAIWKGGAAVIPSRTGDIVLTGYTEPNQGGRELKMKQGNHPLMGTNSNTMRSFVLRRGYMATLASGERGRGYSRVYVADHSDIVVDLLPEQLDRRVSSVNIRPWQYVGKKGWCSTQGTTSILNQMERLNTHWFYTWSADRQTTADAEYVPIRQHIYWPSLSQINGLTTSTHVLGINEPEHSEQHSNDKCSCGGAIDSWKATTLTPDLQESGMRIGSPAPTEMSWLYEYIGHCDDMTYRCDFVAIHAYWGPNEADGASAWYNQLKAIYDKTHRPIWITEWAYGASWTKESWPSGYNDQLEKNRAAIMDIVDMLERCPFVERYSYYQWDTSSRRFMNDDGWITPAGRVYRDTETDFAYRADQQYIPHWWKPSTKAATLACRIDAAEHLLTFTMGNTNGDCTDSFVLQRITADGTVNVLYEVTERSQLENDTFTYSIPLDKVDRQTDRFRVVSTTVFGGKADSGTVTAGFLQNCEADDGLEAWTCTTLSTNKGEAWNGDAANVYWDQWKANGLTSSMSQPLVALEDGDYSITVLARGSSNVTITFTAAVNHADGSAETYKTTLQGTGNSSAAGDPLQNGWHSMTLPTFSAAVGDNVTLSLTAQGSGSAWWSADHVQVQFTPLVTAIRDVEIMRHDNALYDLQGRRVTIPGRGIYLIHGKKVFIQ